MVLHALTANGPMPRLPDGPGPIIVMVHGYKFSPDLPRHDPFDHILSMTPSPGRRSAVSWPRHLGFRGRAEDGLALGFGWHARGAIWRVTEAALEAGAALARIIETLQTQNPARPIHAIAHSLGARVVLEAMARLEGPALNRVILLSPADWTDHAEAALTSVAGDAAEVFNITARENDLFDTLLARAVPQAAPVLGLGLPGGAPNWLDIQLDHPQTEAGLARLGHRLAPSNRAVCHWSCYLRPGAFPFYKRLLRAPETLPMTQLRAALPAQMQPKWSRLPLVPTAKPAILQGTAKGAPA
ncbi:alpha/beta hydrolase [Cognatishimia sp. MH4019]|uniref:alpha/beta hydrolase n=1 Tax=Cognatishimia sp. MH4019 TaxID=2854030 RepID=UPI001CD25447|nr:alpha/beta hydrolase [Cognatishimia sp. MH4019]